MSFKAGAIVGEAVLDIKKWNTGVTGITNSMKSITRAGKTMAVAVAGALTASTIAGNAFQIEMANVSTVMDDAAGSTQDLTLALLGLDPRLGKTIDLTESLYLAFSAGSETMDEALTTTVDSAKFAAAALTDSTTALDILTSATNAYGKEVVTTTQASDIFFKTVEEGKITGDQLSATIGQSIPLYASAGVELEQLGAGIAAMTKQGVSASEATTQLNAIINTMLRPTEAMKDALEDYGFASGGAMLASEGLAGVLKLVEKETQGNTDAIAELTPNLRAVRGFLALTGEGGKIYTDVLNQMSTATGATDRAFAKQERTFVTLRAEMDKVGIVTGNIAKFFIDDLAVGLTNATTGVLNFIMSAEGMELVGDIAAYTAGTFNLLKTVAEQFSDLMTEGNIDEDIEDIGNASVTAASGLSWLSDANEIAALTTFALGEAVLNTGTGISKFATAAVANFDFIKTAFGAFKLVFEGASKAEIAAFDRRVASLREAAITANNDFDNTILDMNDAFFAELMSKFVAFQETSTDRTKDLELSFTSSFENMKESTLKNWLEMITGQKLFNDTTEDLGDDRWGYSKFNADRIQETETTFLENIKEAWDEHFAEGELTWETGYTFFMETAAFALDSIQTISDLFFANQFDALQLETNRELTEWDRLHLGKLTKLQEADSIESALKADYRQNEIDSLQTQLDSMVDISDGYRQEELDKFKEKTEEEIALDVHRRDQYVTRLAGSLDMADQLELAAFLVQEKRDAEELALEEEIFAERERLATQFDVDEKARIAELAKLEKEVAKEKKDAEDKAVQEEQDRLDALELAEDLYNKGVVQIEKDALAEYNKIAEEQFNINKALSLASVAMDTASTIAGFWAGAALLGPVAGPIAAGVGSLLAVGMGAAQADLINAQQFIPAREQGGMTSGMTRVNESGGEIITLPDNSQVIPNDISRQIADNAGSMDGRGDVNINFYDTQISESVDVTMLTEEISYTLGKQLRRA